MGYLSLSRQGRRIDQSGKMALLRAEASSAPTSFLLQLPLLAKDLYRTTLPANVSRETWIFVILLREAQNLFNPST